jgi:hypothetical protein
LDCLTERHNTAAPSLQPAIPNWLTPSPGS